MRSFCLVLIAALGAAPAASQDFYFENFDDGAHDLALFGGASHTVGGGISNQFYEVEGDGDGFDFELLLQLRSLPGDESSTGSRVWPAARVTVPAVSNQSFVVSAEVQLDEAYADGDHHSLSVGLVARCSNTLNPDLCSAFDASQQVRLYRLSYAIVGGGDFVDLGAPLATGELRLYEQQGDGQVDETVTGIPVAAGVPFTMELEGIVVGNSLELLGRMRRGFDVAVVRATDSTPLVGPGFGVRTGGSVRGQGGADSFGVLDADFDDIRVAPEPGTGALAIAAWLFLAALRRPHSRA